MSDEFQSNFVDYKLPLFDKIKPKSFLPISAPIKLFSSTYHLPNQLKSDFSTSTRFPSNKLYNLSSHDSSSYETYNKNYVLPINSLCPRKLNNLKDVRQNPQLNYIIDTNKLNIQITELRQQNHTLNNRLNLLKNEIYIREQQNNDQNQKMLTYYEHQEKCRMEELKTSFCDYLNKLKKEASEKELEITENINNIKVVINNYRIQLKETEEFYSAQHEHYLEVKERHNKLNDEKDAAMKTVNQFLKTNTSLSADLENLKSAESQNDRLLQSLKYKYRQAKMDIVSAKKLDHSQVVARQKLVKAISYQNHLTLDLQAQLTIKEKNLKMLEKNVTSSNNAISQLEQDIAIEENNKQNLLHIHHINCLEMEKLNSKIQSAHIHTQTVNKSSKILRRDSQKLQRSIDQQTDVLRTYQDFILKQSQSYIPNHKQILYQHRLLC